MRRRQDDSFKRLAREQGLRSRAYFKLLDIDRRFDVIKQGDIVIDIGAAPGGWLKYIVKKIGYDGLAIGIDKRNIEPFDEPNVIVVKEDIFSDQIIKKLREILDEEKADVIVSDASPNISGIYEVDSEKIYDINRRVIYLCDKFLRRGGNLILKTFEGRHENNLIKLLKKRFRILKRYKPKASRKRSSETYFIGINFRPQHSRGKYIPNNF